jgi:hypothetical protein
MASDSFEVQFNVPLHHQCAEREITVMARYWYVPGLSTYLDYKVVLAEIVETLTHYPYPKHAWERLNWAVCRRLLDRFVALNEVEITISVPPTPAEPYRRSSTVRLRRDRKHPPGTAA